MQYRVIIEGLVVQQLTAKALSNYCLGLFVCMPGRDVSGFTTE